MEKIGSDGKTSANEEKREINELIKCVEVHRKVKEFTSNVEKNFSVIIFIQGLMSSILFCTTIFLVNINIVSMIVS